jgi:hypothetical protein
MSGPSQPPQDRDPAVEETLTANAEPLTAAGGSLSAAEIRALAAADRAAGGGWPLPAEGGAMPAELQALSDRDLAGVYAAAVVEPLAGLRSVGPVPDRTAAGCGLGGAAGGAGGSSDGGGGGGAGWGFAEGGVLDGAAPSLALAGFAEEACGRLDEVDDDSLIGVLRASRRLVSAAQARELAVLAELARRRPVCGTAPGPPGQLPSQVSAFVAEEVAAALTLTGRAAQAQLELAVDLAVHWRTAAALAAGRIDLAKALVLLGFIGPLGEIEAAAVEAAVLPEAGGLTTGELRAWLARLVLSVDPAAARRRREQAERQAHVACWTDPEGTATLAGRLLPPAEVLAADQRLTAIAQAWKQAGAQGGMDLLRAHAYLALLLGHDTTTPPAFLLDPTGPPPPDPGAAGTAAGTAGPRTGADGQPGAGASGKDGQPVPDPVPAGWRRPGDSAPPLPVTGTVNLTIPLITLLGLADRPGEVPGYGPLHADTCRTLAGSLASHPATAWSVLVTDPGGRAMGLGGPARLRPVKPPGGARGSPAAHSAGGWTVTLTTQPIAPYP